jgi:uncharacterized protein YegP (UPF0339 family)
MLFFFIYTNKAGEYRWQLRNAHKRVLADSGESYKSKKDVQYVINALKRDIKVATIHGI